MAKWLPSIIEALERLGGVAHYDAIYQEIAKLRPTLPLSYKKIIQRKIQDHSSDSDGYKGRVDHFYSVEGKGSGIWGLRGQGVQQLSPLNDACDIDVPPARLLCHTYRVLRDTELVRKLKALHRNCCQICGCSVDLADRQYSEGHHLQPLGSAHNGPDVAANILVLCPNHHVMCDFGAIALQSQMLRMVPEHVIRQEYLDYHNAKICRKSRQEEQL